MRSLIPTLALCIFALPAYAKVEVVSGPPSGFEQMEAPRATVITISYGGAILGQFPAHFTPASLILDEPEKLVGAIPNIKSVDVVTNALSGALPTNLNRMCHKQTQTNCGTLEPDIAGVIFDAPTLSAELFINRTYLSVSDVTGPRYLPMPNRHLSSVYSFNGAIAGNSKTGTNYALSNQSVYAYGEGRLTAQSTYANDGMRFDTVAASVDRSGWEGTAGLFRSRGMQLLSDHDIAGLSVATSLRTRLDSRKTEGNNIILYLPRRAIVSIYREGRIYSARSYEAGNQAVDTSELPEGAYNITLQIQEPDGATREETRFFAKSPDLPPPDDPTYYFQGGVIREPSQTESTVPQLTDRPLLRLGTVQRINDNLGVDVGLLGINDRAALETGAFMLDSTIRMRGTTLLSTKGDVGLQGSYLYTKDAWNISADARKIWASEPAQNILNPVITSLTQATGSIDYGITNDTTLSLRGSTISQGDTSYSSYGPSLQSFLWRAGESMLTLTGDVGKTDNETTANLFLRLTMRFGNYGVSASTGYNRDREGSGAIADGRVWYDESTPEESFIIGANSQHNTRDNSVGLDADWRNSLGRIRGLVEQNWGGTNSSLGYGGNFTINAAQVEDTLALGGNQADTSAVIVSLAGDADVPMKIMVAGMQRGLVNPGESQAIYLSPYQTYDIRLSPAKSSMVRYDTKSQRITLYPGNVERLHWDVNHFYVVLAKLVTPDGEPLVGAELQENNEVITDSKGRLHAPMTKADRLTFITKETEACEAVLPPGKEVNGVIMYQAPLVCQPIPS